MLLTALPAGLLLGLGALWGLLSLLRPFLIRLVDSNVSGFLENASIQIQCSFLSAACIVGISVITVLCAAAIPAARVAGEDPIESIRGAEQSGRGRIAGRRDWLSLKSSERLLARAHMLGQKEKTGSMICAMVVLVTVLTVTIYAAVSAGSLFQVPRPSHFGIELQTEGWDYWINDLGGTDWYQAVKEELQEVVPEEDRSEFILDSCAPENAFYSTEYVNAIRELLQSVDPETMQLEEYLSEKHSTIELVALDERNFSRLAQSCGYQEFSDDGDAVPVIVCQEALLTADYYDQKELLPREEYKNYVHLLHQVTDRKVGDTFSITELWTYDPETDGEIEAEARIAGFATQKDLEPFFYIEEDTVYIITSADGFFQIQRRFLKYNPKLVENSGYHNMLVRTSAGSAADEKIQNMIERLGDGAPYDGIGRVGELSEEEVTAIAYRRFTFILLGTFLALLFLICTLSLYNTMAVRAVLRRREFAILQSVGMTAQQQKRILFYENIGMLFLSMCGSVLLTIPGVMLVDKGLDRIYWYLEKASPWPILLGAWTFTGIILFAVTAFQYRKKENGELIEQLRVE